MSKPTHLIIVGPTAAGKTALSLSIAGQMGWEILSADSRQVFRQMDVVTAKPSRSEQEYVKHHFIDLIDPDEVYDAGRFGSEARSLLAGLWSAGKNALTVGGSGLYIKALVDGFFENVSRNEEVRTSIREKIRANGLSSVHEELLKIDPIAAQRIHPNDAKRIERALEVYILTGRTMSEIRSEQQTLPPFNVVTIGLSYPRDVLYERINRRVETMLASGAIEETEMLLGRGYDERLVSMEGLGYREITDFLKGRTSRETMVNLFKQRTRNYAKRQLTWFSKDTRITWFDASTMSIAQLTAQVIRQYQDSAG